VTDTPTIEPLVEAPALAETHECRGCGSLSRRSVLAGAGALGAALTLAACGAEGSAPGSGGTGASTSEPGSSEPTTADGESSAPAAAGAVAKVSEVPVGGVIAAELDGTPVFVAQPSEGTFVALAAICTHQGCNLAPDGAQLACPCHGSTFALDGAVTRGPASEDLPSIQLAVEGENLVVAQG